MEKLCKHIYNKYYRHMYKLQADFQLTKYNFCFQLFLIMVMPRTGSTGPGRMLSVS